MSSINLKIAKLYVDDKTIVTEPVPLGARFRNDCVEIIEDEIENDRATPADIK